MYSKKYINLFKVLTNLPLCERLEKIKTVVKPSEGRVVISPRVSVQSRYCLSDCTTAVHRITYMLYILTHVR